MPLRITRRNKTVSLAYVSVIALLVAVSWSAVVQSNPQGSDGQSTLEQGERGRGCAADNGGITLSPGFCATVFADNLGHVRHMVVAPNGVLYVNTWSGWYYHNAPPPAGGFLIALSDSKGVGKADMIERFGPGVPQRNVFDGVIDLFDRMLPRRLHIRSRINSEGSAGGTGIALYNGALYAEQNDKILRYALPKDSSVPHESPQVVVSDLPLTGDHPMHPFIIDSKGGLFVDLGSATNSCQSDNRMPNVLGEDPCNELKTRAGTWRYDANSTDQHFSPNERFATGLRNGEGFAFDSAGRLFATQHGRDELGQNWSNLYTAEQGARQPAEELVLLQAGADYGWPECYYDRFQQKLVLAPEYGGDGGKKVGICADKIAPIAAFPAHWAPNDLLIYNGHAFPPAYQGGAFIAFHGSSNRGPEAHGGYNVVFQPLKDGKAVSNFVVFADGFAGGAVKEPDRAAFRPTGLAMGPDGALYISDDVHGRIWRVTFHGSADTPVAAAPAPAVVATSSGEPGPPEGIHPEAGRLDPASLPVPPGASKDEVELGDRIFHGEAADGTCSGCHGSDARGGPQAPSLVKGHWLIGDGSLNSITEIIADGVPRRMPPKGGTLLSDSDVAALSAYVWSISHAASR